MNDYKPNSYKSKAEQQAVEKKEVKKVVNGPVRIKKKNELRKLKDTFVTEDISNVKSYLLRDVIVPALIDTVEDIFVKGIRMFLRGESGARKSSTPASKVSYNRFYDSRDDDRRDFRRTSSVYDLDDIVLDSYGEAEEVLSSMQDLISTYGAVTVADLYDLIGKSCNYTDNNYGWMNIRNAEPVRVRGGGYMLKLPKPLPLAK